MRDDRFEKIPRVRVTEFSSHQCCIAYCKPLVGKNETSALCAQLKVFLSFQLED